MSSPTFADLHMLFFPYMAQGHILPMVDMAKFFAARGASVTILTTPANVPFISPTTTSSSSLHPLISFHVIPFPSAAAGLPEGCENRAFLPSNSLLPNFYRALALLRGPFSESLQLLRPDCVVSDVFLPWTYHASADLGIPRILFDGNGFISHCVEHVWYRHRPLDNLPPAAESFVFPCLPHRIEMLISQTMEHAKKTPWPGSAEFEAINRERKEVNSKNYGVLINSFYELEPDYIDYYRNVIGRKAWGVGPAALFAAGKTPRGYGNGSAGGDEPSEWLGRQKAGSVIYLCFGSASFHLQGSASSLVREQIGEIAAGLEAAAQPFLWVLRGGGGEELLPEGFEERVVREGKGMVIKGWAQQLEILGHVAVGGFVTHCGWNSVLEGISSGVPMLTWPLFADQFINERLVVDVVRVGVGVGSRVNSLRAEERTLVAAGAVEKAVREVMGDGEEAEGRRRRVRELAEKAGRAVEEGGSSYDDALNLIHELMERKVKIAAGAGVA